MNQLKNIGLYITTWKIRVIDYILKGTQIMATIVDVNEAVAALAAAQGQTAITLANLDVKLDEIRAFIQALQVGSPVTQEQLDALFNMVDAAKVVAQENSAKAGDVLAETDALDE